MLFFKTSLHDYERLCSLDCLSIEERQDDSNYAYERFQKQSGREPGDFYEPNLTWKDNHPALKNNKSNSLGRLSSLVKNLRHRNQLERYNNIIQDQIKEDIVENLDEVCEKEIAKGEKVFYSPHKPVIKESDEKAKLRIALMLSQKQLKILQSTFPKLSDEL